MKIYKNHKAYKTHKLHEIHEIHKTHASFTLHGIPVSQGIAIGRAYLIAAAALEVDHYLIDAAQVDVEVARFFNAQKTVQQEFDNLRDELPPDAPTEMKALLDVHGLILRDPMLTEATVDLIRSHHCNAEWALIERLKQFLQHFDKVSNEYLRDRKVDIEHVVERVLQVLSGSTLATAPAIAAAACAIANNADGGDGHGMIIVAHDIAPADMLQFKTQKFNGFITECGGRTSHTAIAARSLGIPAAVGVQQAGTLIRYNDLIIIDGEQGVVIVDPAPIVLKQYTRQQSEKMLGQGRLQQLKFSATKTVDGTPIHLYANIELPKDAGAAMDMGACGIGLFRTEFLFMNRGRHLPDEEEQLDAYQRVVKAMKGRPVTIRTLDVGADKPFDLHHTNRDSSEIAANPALGLRAIRWALSEPQIFLTHLRAMLRASAFGTVNILFPMLGSAQEIDQTLSFVAQAKRQCADAGLPYDPKVKLGAMIEIPAAALALPLFLKRLDFISIGTNDLIQYTLAIDRSDSSVAHLYEPLHPAILRLINDTLRQAKHAGIPVSVCGEIAGDPTLTRLLLGMGLTEFSMQPGQLLVVKQEILRAHLPTLKKWVGDVLTAYEPEELQAALTQLANV